MQKLNPLHVLIGRSKDPKCAIAAAMGEMVTPHDFER